MHETFPTGNDQYLPLLVRLLVQAYFPGGGGGTWVYRGAHTLVIKIKKYP